jgi:hypothetical protein
MSAAGRKELTNNPTTGTIQISDMIAIARWIGVRPSQLTIPVESGLLFSPDR